MLDVPQFERQLLIFAVLSESKRGLTIDDIINSLDQIGIDFSRKAVERDIE